MCIFTFLSRFNSVSEGRGEDSDLSFKESVIII